MTTTFTSEALTRNGFKKSRKSSKFFSQNIYQVEVTGEDGDYMTFEVLADTYAEATATAEQLAMEQMIDIQFINVISMD